MVTPDGTGEIEWFTRLPGQHWSVEVRLDWLDEVETYELWEVQWRSAPLAPRPQIAGQAGAGSGNSG